MKKVAPSILGKDKPWDLINDLLTKGVDTIHYDTMDGYFVDNTSFPLKELLEMFSKTNHHQKDVHLMVDYPEAIVDALIDKADMISIHYESQYVTSMDKIIDKYKDTKKIGIAINPDTDVEVIFEYLPKVKHILLMSVWPGRGGQDFIESTYDKIKLLRKEIDKNNLDVIIEIDGGINFETGPKAFELGVDIAVSGSCVLNTIDDGGMAKIIKNNK